ncbi:MAG: AraC family transcriptional regulator [Nitrospirae bacterium]|nr:MAG: AraC family transcriptional regulator [Nitrospirota bacterium]
MENTERGNIRHQSAREASPRYRIPVNSATQDASQHTWVGELQQSIKEWTRQLHMQPWYPAVHPIIERALTRLMEEVNQASLPPLSQKIHHYLQTHLRQGPTLKDLSHFLGYSEKYCSELFHSQMGESFSSYVKRLRLETAKRLLCDPSMTIAQIADAVGFHDQFAFSHFFKKATSYSPRAYRQLLITRLSRPSPKQREP